MSDQHASSISCHILIVTYQSWGHYKTAIGFACKLLQERPDILITFISAGEHTRLAKVQTDDNYLLYDQSSKPNLRFVHIGGEGTLTMDLDPVVREHFESICKNLVSPENLIKSFDGSVYTNPRKLDLFLCDILWPGLFKIFRDLPGCNNIPVLTWVSPATSGTVYLTGPEELGGPGDVPAKAKLLAEESGKTPSEIELELYKPKGEILHMFGGIDIYDYEAYPEGHDTGPFFPLAVNLCNEAHRGFVDTDGLVLASNEILEPEANQACRKWCSERGKSCYVVGSFVSSDDQLEIIRSQFRESGSTMTELENFLDKMYASHGPHSVLYICFGTIYFPSLETLLIVLEVVLEMKIPLVFVHDPARHGEIPSEFRAKLDESGLTFISEWTMQELVLYHKATGLFLTHCGLGSLTEAVRHNIPIVAWPILAEQPYSAIYFTLKLDIGYQLFNVRKGTGLKPLLRGITPTNTKEAIIEEVRNVLTKAFGEDGQEKRRNVEQLRSKLNLLWKKDGDSVKEMRRFIADYFPKERLDC